MPGGCCVLCTTNPTAWTAWICLAAREWRTMHGKICMGNCIGNRRLETYESEINIMAKTGMIEYGMRRTGMVRTG